MQSLPRIAVLSLILVTLGLTSVADEGSNSFELFVGNAFLNLDSDNDDLDTLLDNEQVFGLRAGHRFGERWGAELSVTRLDFDDSVSAPLDGGTSFLDFGLEATMLDLSATYRVPGRRGSWLFFAGPGWVFVEAEARLRGTSIADRDDEDLFSAHAGIAYVANLGERFYLRPDVRGRWIEETGGEPDFEASLALGIRF